MTKEQRDQVSELMSRDGLSLDQAINKVKGIVLWTN